MLEPIICTLCSALALSALWHIVKRLKIRCAIRSDAGRVCTYFFLSFADEGVWFGLVERVSVHVEVSTLKEYGGRYIYISSAEAVESYM